MKHLHVSLVAKITVSNPLASSPSNLSGYLTGWCGMNGRYTFATAHGETVLPSSASIPHRQRLQCQALQANEVAVLRCIQSGNGMGWFGYVKKSGIQ